MSVCPDCGNPWTINHPATACGAGPDDKTLRIKIDVNRNPNDQLRMFAVIWYCARPALRGTEGWCWHWESEAPDGERLVGVTKGRYESAAKTLYGFAEYLYANDKELLELLLPTILAHFVEVDTAPRAGNGPNDDPELLALTRLLDQGKRDLPPVAVDTIYQWDVKVTIHDEEKKDA